MKAVTLVTTLAALSCAALAEERDARFFDGSFFRDRDNLHMRGQLRLDSLQDTMDQFTSSLNTAMDRLSDTIEEQVAASLPLRLRGTEDTDESGEEFDGLEAISGSFGEGIDDGLRTHFSGDLEGEKVDGPRYEEPTTASEEEVEFTEDVDSTPNFSYRPTFPFGPFSPFAGNPWRRPGTGLFDFMNRRPAWWKGPNVCVEREEIDEGKDLDSSIREGEDTTSSGATLVFSVGNMQVTSCTETRNRYTCTSRISRRGIYKTVVVTHKCCHGYVREGAGCSKVDLRSMTETLEEIGANDFLTLAKTANMMEMLDQNVTLFVPTNEAMQEFMVELEMENELELEGVFSDRADNEVYPALRPPVENKGTVMAHGTEGVLYASDLRDEQVLPSMMEGATLRINAYSTVPPVATVNCARMISVNQHSTNGVVHSIDKVLQPVTRSLAELITSDPQFSILYQLISKSGFLDTLREPGQLTLFAPTDAAFRTLPSSILDSLLSDNACLDSIVKNHILPNVICSAAVQSKARTDNLLKEYLMVERTEDDDIFVDDVKVVARDVMGTNGVMHVVEKPIMPSAARNVIDVIRSHNLTRFLDMVEAAEMLDELAGAKDVTIFVPSNRAIESMPDGALEDIMSDKEKLRDLLNYHITTSPLSKSDITNNHIATTRSDQPLRINIYNRVPLLSSLVGETRNQYVRFTAGCSRISTLDSRACGAVVHVVERLFTPPRPTVLEHLEADDDFSMFTKMLYDTGINEMLVGEGPFTVLAPSDHVFRALPQTELQQIMDDKEVQERLVKQHILKEHLCCAGINPNTWIFMDMKRALDGSPVHLRRTTAGRLMAGPARITHCSAPSKNGVVHTVNHLLLDVNPIVRQNRTPIFSAPGLQFLFG